jgi:hypothetical protein
MICHEYKTIFVHIPKNAGQSIEHVFLDLLNLTWETRSSLLLRYNENPNAGPFRLAHLKASEYVQYKYLSADKFEKYFKFAFVRNPWSRMVSVYKYLRFDIEYDFKTFVMEAFRNPDVTKDTVLSEREWFLATQADFLCDESGRLMVDFVGKVENIQTDFEYVCEKLGIPFTVVPHVNESKQGRAGFGLKPGNLIKFMRRHRRATDKPALVQYQDYYDDETKEFVASFFKRDIDLFGYDFE